MPKIEIKEKDYTTPGFGTYPNFAILVPGFVSAAKRADFLKYADGETEILELSSISEFNEHVGKVAPGKPATNCVYATPVVFPVNEGEEPSEEPEDPQPDEILELAGILVKLTGSQFYSTYKNQVYILDPNTPVISDGSVPMKDDKKLGHLWVKYIYNDTPYFYKVKSVYDEVEEGEEPDYDKDAEYIVILTGNEGTDEAAKVEFQYGNQIAYELLKLGYPVLYKKLDNINQLNSDEFWDGLLDKSNYTFRFILNGLLNDNAAANNSISRLAKERGDCTALVDIDEDVYTDMLVKTSPSKIISAIAYEANRLSDADQYTAIFAPSLCYNITQDAGFDNNTKFPASFHYLACFNQILKTNYAEWFAAAGLNRGVSTYSVVGTEVKLGEIAEHALEPRFKTSFIDKEGAQFKLARAVNIIERIRGSYYLYGNRTAYLLGDEGTKDGDLVASHFLNIRQLCTSLKHELYAICKNLTFDPNSTVLWVNFCNAIRPTLETMKADQGIKDYDIVQLESDQKAKLCARIRIVPIEAVEDFDIEISLEDALGENAVTILE